MGLGGLSGSTALTAVIDTRVAMWFAAVFAAVLAVSGALAITVKRTVFSKRAQAAMCGRGSRTRLRPGLCWSRASGSSGYLSGGRSTERVMPANGP